MMPNCKEESPHAVDCRQTGAAQEQGKHPERARSDCTIPITAQTATWWVERIKKDCPKDYAAIANKAIGLSRAGVRMSISSLFEWARLELFEERKGKGVFKLNNTLRPAFARALMRDYPELEGKFETRRSASDSVEADNAEA